jgi:hypothetical protein
MPKIGVFWFYKQNVVGRSIAIEAGEESVPGIIDSADTHADLWDNDRSLLQDFPELRGTEYHKVPRGRVLWQKDTELAKIYLDEVLFAPEIKSKILEFFDLIGCNVQWGRDVHYTTKEDDLSRLFGEG